MSKDPIPSDFGRTSGYKSDLEVADSDFSQIQRKGDAICSIPALNSTSPFFYYGHKEGV